MGDNMRAHNMNTMRATTRKVGSWAVSLVLAAGALFNGVAFAQEVLPVPPEPFKGEIGLSARDSKPDLLNEIATLNGIEEDYREVLKHKNDLGTWKTHNHYPVVWVHAMDTPFQWFKQIASHYGGTRNGMVISWPARIKDQGGIRSQWHHVIDIAPTILEVAGLQMPAIVNGVAQKPIEGVSYDVPFKFTGTIEKVVVNLGETSALTTGTRR
jgi:arylsulfatase A-like enzyme